MKLKKISVDKLFGIFDHEIEINNDVGITIIIGENGLGKTAILEMTQAFFNRDYFYFNSINFEKMSFEFLDGTIWELKKNDEKTLLENLTLTQIDKDNKRSLKPIKLYSEDESTLKSLAMKLSRMLPNLRRIGPNEWRDVDSREDMTAIQVVRKYNHYIMKDFVINETRHDRYYNTYMRDETPSLFDENEDKSWFIEKHEEIKVTLIETQRLISLNNPDDRKTHEKMVEKYSDELKRTLKSNLTESTKLSSKLDRTYPNRLIERIKSSSNISEEELSNRLNELEKKRETLDKVGLIEIEEDSNMLEINTKQQDVIKEVLMLYVEDSFEKIEIFDEISRKIEIFLKIVNKRFKHKKIYIDKERGFYFKSTIIKKEDDEFQNIPLSKLSSGEQNELVLFYLLLFKTEKNSLILIDEPEVSLHISWQKSFIEDLREISDLNNLDILIATHSPDIIFNNWDLTIELEGKE